jgi:hypothetical protein
MFILDWIVKYIGTVSLWMCAGCLVISLFMSGPTHYKARPVLGILEIYEPSGSGYVQPIIKWIGWISFALLLSLVSLGFLTGITDRWSPYGVASKFCTAYDQLDYQTAYDTLSSRLQSEYTEKAFEKYITMKRVDAGMCDGIRSNDSGWFSQATISFSFLGSESIYVIQDHGIDYRIDGIKQLSLS